MQRKYVTFHQRRFRLHFIDQFMETNLRPLTDEANATIRNDYLAGQKPAAIAKKIGAKVATVRQSIWRQKLTGERAALKEAAARTAGEVIEDARKRHAEKLTGILDAQIESLVTDSERLRDGWPLAQDAAGASSLMRAKALFQDRALQYFGLAAARDEPTPTIGISFFMGSLVEPAKTTEAEAIMIGNDAPVKS